MSKYSEKNRVTDRTRDEATKIARGTQKPGQTKEQTKLIAQGIRNGIDQYKKKQNAKARELDKKLKKAAASSTSDQSSTDNTVEQVATRTNILPWALLIITWLGFAAYLMLIK